MRTLPKTQTSVISGGEIGDNTAPEIPGGSANTISVDTDSTNTGAAVAGLQAHKTA